MFVTVFMQMYQDGTGREDDMKVILMVWSDVVPKRERGYFMLGIRVDPVKLDEFITIPWNETFYRILRRKDVGLTWTLRKPFLMFLAQYIQEKNGLVRRNVRGTSVLQVFQNEDLVRFIVYFL